MRIIPATMATQHPDNACSPAWGQSPFISTLDEVDECYRVFAELDCDEYMWDWEGKFVDEAVVDRLFNKYESYFRKCQLGRDKFLTYRIPNIWQERGIRLARSFMTILTAAHTAQDYGVHTPPLFEIILPMTTSADQLIAILEKFRRAEKVEHAIFEESIKQGGRMEMIPLIEGSVTLLESRPLLKTYVQKHKALFGKKPAYLRPFIARSDPALDAGFVPATLSARCALSEYYRFQEESGIPIFPIIGAGPPLFRGGLSPESLDRFFELYVGVRTVTVQSSFRYDYPLPEVKAAIRKIRRLAAKGEPEILGKKDLQKAQELIALFSDLYRPTILGLAGVINEIARYVPQHRERIPHTGHFGYSRSIGKDKTDLPRAITFNAVFSSLGIPAAIIGTGRGLREAKRLGRLDDVLRFFPGLEKDLEEVGHYLNWENLKFLCRKSGAWLEIMEDVRLIEDFLGKRLEPATSRHFIHRNLASNIYHLWQSGNETDLRQDILHAGVVRRYLG